MIIIEPLLTAHAKEVLEIYQEGIETGMATFETSLPGWANFDEKHHKHSRLVAIDEGSVNGWAVLSPVSARECYAGVAEVSVYVRSGEQGKGLGKRLLNALIVSSERNGIWSLLSVIDEENIASIHLHQQCGFRLVGYRERIAQLNGKWRTTAMMERRSSVVGI